MRWDLAYQAPGLHPCRLDAQPGSGAAPPSPVKHPMWRRQRTTVVNGADRRCSHVSDTTVMPNVGYRLESDRRRGEHTHNDHCRCHDANSLHDVSFPFLSARAPKLP
jgi:hypothetical protein